MAKLRSTIEEKYKWRLDAIFKDEAELEKAFSAVDENIAKLKMSEGKIDVEGALRVLSLDNDTGKICDAIYVYTHLKSDEDASDSKNRSLAGRAEMLLTEYGSAASWLMPALSEMDDSALGEIAQKNPDFSRIVDGVKRMKAHCLSDKEERLLAEASSFSSDFKNIFAMFNNADILFDSVTGADGEKVEMTHGTYSALLQEKDREVRKQAFLSHYKAYKQHINFIAANYYAYVKKNVFTAKIRHFDGPLDKALYGEEISKKTYDALLRSVEKGLSRVHDYVAFRKKMLNGELNMYDMYVPLFETKASMPYEEAYATVTTALAPLGAEYQQLLQKAYDGGWIDVFENKGKRGGAYSWGAYGSHPYVLLNYAGTVHDTFTVAHEMGHALHSYFSNQKQCFTKAGYCIFVAEVASTVNEVLLLKHLIKKAEGEEKKFLLSYYLDMFRTTLFRQTMFAEFEAFSHAEVQSGKPLTVDSLSDKYYELNKKYYGDSVTHNEDIRYEWARIPHFYTAFYVYKYATGLTSAVSIASAIAEGKEGAKDNYLKMLSLGGSLPPLDLLRIAGVDLETEAPYEKALSEFDAVLKELESL